MRYPTYWRREPWAPGHIDYWGYQWVEQTGTKTGRVITFEVHGTWYKRSIDMGIDAYTRGSGQDLVISPEKFEMLWNIVPEVRS